MSNTRSKANIPQEKNADKNTPTKTPQDMDSVHFQMLMTRLDNIDKNMSDIKGSVNEINIKLANLSATVDSVSAVAEKNATDIQSIKYKLDQYEQYSRRSNLRFFGIPEAEKEDTDKVILDILQNKMDITLSILDLERTHRVGKKKDGATRPRAIIVKFSSYRIRSLVFNKKKCLKKTGIVVREDLTSLRQKALVEASAVFGKNCIWTYDGRFRWVQSTEEGATNRSGGDLAELFRAMKQKLVF